MRFVPYLNFDGTCGEAFARYEQILGGRLEVMTFADMPGAAPAPATAGDRVLHARLIVGEQTLMGSDTPPGQPCLPQGMHVALQLDRPGDAERIFRDLADQGVVTMPLEATFFAARFGMCIDRFGTPWMVNCEQPD